MNVSILVKDKFRLWDNIILKDVIREFNVKMKKKDFLLLKKTNEDKNIEKIKIHDKEFLKNDIVKIEEKQKV